MPMTGLIHWQDSAGRWWHEIHQGGKGHPADPAHSFQVVDMPCRCDPKPTCDETGPFAIAGAGTGTAGKGEL